MEIDVAHAEIDPGDRPTARRPTLVSAGSQQPARDQRNTGEQGIEERMHQRRQDQPAHQRVKADGAAQAELARGAGAAARVCTR